MKIDSERQIAQILRSAWKEKGINDYEIAEDALEISRASIKNKIHGTTHFTFAEIMLIIHRLGYELHLVRKG